MILEPAGSLQGVSASSEAVHCHAPHCTGLRLLSDVVPPAMACCSMCNILVVSDDGRSHLEVIMGNNIGWTSLSASSGLDASSSNGENSL